MAGYPLAGLEVSRGIASGNVPIFKFGRNSAVPTTITPVTLGGNYRMPLPADAQALRVQAGGDVNDTVAGSGSRKIRLQGLDANGDFLEQDLDLAGASASALTPTPFWRLYRMSVIETGTYATAIPTNSATRDIIVEDAGGNEWGRIAQTPNFRRGQSEIGFYTVLNGYTAYITDVVFSTDVAAKTDFFLMQRPNALAVGGIYQPFRMLQEYQDVSGVQEIRFAAPLGPIRAGTDFGFFARASSGTVDVQVQIDFILVQEDQPDLTVIRT